MFLSGYRWDSLALRNWVRPMAKEQHKTKKWDHEEPDKEVGPLGARSDDMTAFVFVCLFVSLCVFFN